MGRFDERKKQLGVKVTERSAQTSSTSSSGGGSRFDRRRSTINTKREDERQASIKRAEERKEPKRQLTSTEKKIMSDTLSGPSFLQRQPTPQATSLPSPGQLLQQQHQRFQPQPEFEPVQASPLARALGLDKKPLIGPSLTDIAESVTKDPLLRGVSRGAAFGLGDNVMPQRTGPTPFIEKAGEFAGMLFPGAAAERAAATALRPVISNIPRIGQFAARGAGAGALHGGATETAQEFGGLNDQTLLQRLGDVGLETALGGGLGALSDVPRLLGNKAQDVARGIVGRDVGTTSAIESAAASVPTGRLRVQSNTEQLSKLMGDIKPVVTERMTPPLENPRELARWLQPHLGNTSLNEINRLPYEDMVELAEEVRRGLTVPNMARQVAGERGKDLDALLDNRAPNFKQRAEQLRMAGVSGAIDPPQNVRVAIRPDSPNGSAVAQPNVSAPTTALPNTAREIDRPKEAWFTRLFGNRGLGITPGANIGKELVDTQVTTRTREPLEMLEQARALAEQTNQDYIDRFAPFRKINDQTYDAAMDSTRANNLANIAIKDKLVDLEGNVIGNSLADVYSAVPRGQKHIADRYLIARDAIDRMDRQQQVYGKEQWFPQTSQDAAALVNKLENQYPWLKQFGSEWNTFNQNRQNLWVQSGIASQDLINRLRVSNPNYTPMFRQQPRLGLGKRLALNSGKGGFSGQKAPIKRAVGSGRKIIEPAQGMIETTASSYNAMMRNRAMKELYKAVRANPERYKGVMEVVEESADARRNTINTINEALRLNGVDGVADILNDEMNHLWKKAKQSGNTTDNIVTVMLNGDPVKMRVMDPSLLKAIDGITPNQLEGFMKIADMISRGVKQAATGALAPLQGARLFLRDIPVAAAQSKDKVRFLGDLSHAFVSQIADWLPNFVPGTQKLGKLARDYYRAGGGYEAYLKGDSRIRSTASDIVNNPYLSGANIWKQTKRFNPLRALKGFGDMTENLPRIAAYAAEMRKSGWNRTPENVRRAIDAGREATVNWSRRGAKTQGVEAVAPYTNAAIQGTYRFAKRLKEQPLSAIALIAATAAGKIASYEQFKDDTEYQTRSKYDKGIPYTKTADGKFKSIPVEPTEAFIADQILNFYKWAMDKEKLPNAKESIQTGLEAFTPSVISGPASAFTSEGDIINLGKETTAKTLGGTVLEPLIAAGTGKNFFGGDIVPREYQGDPTELQQDATTSAAANWAAENLGIDAFTFDYLAEKFGGDLAKVGLPLTSDVGKADITGNAMAQVNERLKLLEDPIMRNNISDDYYKRLEKVSSAKSYSDRRGTPLPSWYQRAYDEVTSSKKGSLNKAISEFNAMKKEITQDSTLNARERADQLRDVQRNINMLRIQGIKRLEELGVPK